MLSLGNRTWRSMRMLPPPLLDIRHYHIDSFAFVAHDDYDPERDSAGEFDVAFDVTQHEDDVNAYRIEMRVRVADGGYASRENAPYSLNLGVVGYFTFAQEA